MKCREYVFLLTSGQLAEASWPMRLAAGQHRLACRHCRAFTRNDEALDRILAAHRAHVAHLGPQPSAPTDDEPPPP